jgi:hypothetical protein
MLNKSTAFIKVNVNATKKGACNKQAPVKNNKKRLY